MEIEIKDVSLNLLTTEKRVEITVTTVTGEVIIFPSAQVETRAASALLGTKDILYAYAQKVESSPSSKIYTFFMESEEGYPSRQRLTVSLD